MITLDTSDFLRAARNLDRAIQQLPFAFSRALNDAARETREYLVGETWPTHVTVRKKPFIAWALRTEFATKQKLYVEINDARAEGRGHLGLHDTGGVKVARSRLAIPGSYVRRGSNGVITSQRPRNLANSFVKGDVIYQRTNVARKGAKGKRRPGGKVTTAKPGLRLAYVLKSSATIKADVPFSADFERVFRQSFARHAPERIRQAFATMR